MLYFSELTKETYSSPEACMEAEKNYKKEQADLEAKKSASTKRKKELAKSIEDADSKLTEANELYEVARQKAAEILDKSNKEAKQILDDAQDLVKQAQKNKLDAILNFNKEFGTYTTTYTGERAASEFNNTMRRFDDTFKFIWKSLWS